MITPETVQAAVAADDLPTLREMFDALVHYPDQPLPGFSGPSEIVTAFEQVCGALRFDLTPLPEDTFMLLWRLALESSAPLIGQGYGAGADLGIRSHLYFAERFAGKHAFA